VPLFAALARGGEAVAAIQTFLRAGVSPAGAGGLARFLVACQRHDQGARGLEQLALDLLERGADMFAASAEGDPCLALSVRLGWTRLQRRLLECGANVETRDSRGMTALHLAAALGREAALKCLLLHGASPDVRAADGQTPLGVALSSGRRDLADWLDWRIWTLPRRALADADLPAAAMSGDADAVRRLLDLGLPLDAVDAQGCTALLRAAGGGHAAVIDLLLARGADLNLAAHSGATPLSAAVSMRQLDIVGTLLAAGAPIEQKLPGGATVLMLASALGMPDIAARLLAAGADVHAGDAQGLTPLHCAALYGFGAQDPARLLALFDALLLAGAESDLAAGQVTPLLLLLGARPAGQPLRRSRGAGRRRPPARGRRFARCGGPARFRRAASGSAARPARVGAAPAARRRGPGPPRHPQPHAARRRGDARFRRCCRRAGAARRAGRVAVDGALPARSARLSRARPFRANVFSLIRRPEWRPRWRAVFDGRQSGASDALAIAWLRRGIDCACAKRRYVERVDDVHRQGMSRRGLRQRPTSGPETWIKAMRERSFWWCWSSAARTSFLDSG
jgi:ankyrin repeat protein